MAQNTQSPTKSSLDPRVTAAPRAALGTSAVAATSFSAILAVRYLGQGAPAWWLAPVAVAALGVLTLHWLRTRASLQTRLGQYTLTEKIGEGGMGVVYKANHALLRRPAAIKLLSAERADERDLRRFEREVQLTSMLTHPNTIAIYDFGRTSQGTFYYAMEYLEGLDLQTLVDRDGPQQPARVAHLLAQLAGALQEAHAAGLIHRDVKPANVMCCQRGGTADVVKVLDFGLIKEVGSAGEGAQSDVHQIVGTPLYLSPEALIAPERVDARSDLYAVGAVGYFLLTGQPLFCGNSLLEVCGQHLHSEPVPPSERLGAPIPRELELLILSCLEKSSEARPVNAAALQAALLAFAADWTQERAAEWWAEHSDVSSRTPRASRADGSTASSGFAPALAA
jgi:eukaryotic-like serine/threonine-protein kinase